MLTDKEVSVRVRELRANFEKSVKGPLNEAQITSTVTTAFDLLEDFLIKQTIIATALKDSD